MQHPLRASRVLRFGHDHGFTLVEVLVALLIMAIVAAMGWQGVDSMARARDIGSAASERTLRLSALVGQFEQDLAAVYDSPQLAGLSFDGASLRILRRTEAGVQVVVWSLREGVWRRWTSAPTTRQGELQQAWQASQQLQGLEPGQLRLAEGVTEWQIYFWRGQGWSNAQSTGNVVAVGNSAALALPNAAAVALSAAASANGTGTNTAEAVATAPAGNANNPANPNLPNLPGIAGAVTQRNQLPSGVRLQIDLPEGRLLRDVMLPPQS